MNKEREKYFTTKSKENNLAELNHINIEEILSQTSHSW
jgi:hypothetical protein